MRMINKLDYLFGKANMLTHCLIDNFIVILNDKFDYFEAIGIASITYLHEKDLSHDWNQSQHLNR